MKLLTLNTHSWIETNQIAKLHQLAEHIIAADYDVIALQEVNQLAKSPVVAGPSLEALAEIPIREDNYAHLLLEALANHGTTYYGAWQECHTGFDIYEEGVALLAKQPFDSFAALTFRPELPFADVRRRSIIGGVLNIADAEIWFYSGHFSWWSFEGEPLFADEWQAFTAFAEKNGGDQAFIMGDFNNDAASPFEGYPLICEDRQWSDCYPVAAEKQGEHTVTKKIAGWEQNTKQLRIDYVFSRHPAEILRYEIVFDGGDLPQISDHFGIKLEVSQVLTKQDSDLVIASTGQLQKDR